MGVGYDRLFVADFYRNWVVAAVPRALADALRAAFESDEPGGADPSDGWWHLQLDAAKPMLMVAGAAERVSDIDPALALEHNRVFDEMVKKMADERQREFKMNGKRARARARHCRRAGLRAVSLRRHADGRNSGRRDVRRGRNRQHAPLHGSDCGA